jgi:hypothetical protein
LSPSGPVSSGFWSVLPLLCLDLLSRVKPLRVVSVLPRIVQRSANDMQHKFRHNFLFLYKQLLSDLRNHMGLTDTAWSILLSASLHEVVVSMGCFGLKIRNGGLISGLCATSRMHNLTFLRAMTLRPAKACPRLSAIRLRAVQRGTLDVRHPRGIEASVIDALRTYNYLSREFASYLCHRLVLCSCPS